jgi:hypothetical protein
LAEIKPSEAVAKYRSAIEGSLYDRRDIPKEIREPMQAHLKRMFDHVAGMAQHADMGDS